MRYITVPKTLAAMRRLDYDKADPSELKELILSDEDFLRLFNTGVFEEINLKLGSWIADYEYEAIIGTVQLAKLCKMLEARLSTDDDTLPMMKTLHELACFAQERRTGIFFYF
jgi:hypothetical protein